MQKLSKARLEQILANGLSLKDADFSLEVSGSKLSGAIVSEAFRGKRDDERQRIIWDLLDEKLGPESVKLVGMLLAYTPEEWTLGAAKAKHVRHAKAG
jgi:acid stress-induced BolA-like protein IbaG/YrbA